MTENKTDLEKAREFFSGDLFATKASGIVIDEVGEHYARCSMEITRNHQNAYGGVMGGATFTLADYTFAVASNFNQPQTVSVTSQINFTGMAPTFIIILKKSFNIFIEKTNIFIINLLMDKM